MGSQTEPAEKPNYIHIYFCWENFSFENISILNTHVERIRVHTPQVGSLSPKSIEMAVAYAKWK